MKANRYPQLAAIFLRAMKSTTQKQVAAWCGVSQPAVYGWVNGQKLPSPVHLALLAFYLKLDPRELAEAANVNPNYVLSLHEALTLQERAFLDLLEAENATVQAIRKQWRRGDPGFAIEQSIIVDQRLKQALERYSSPNQRQPLLKIRAELLYEQACSFSVGNPPNRAVDLIRANVEERYLIAEELRDDEVLALAYRSRGDSFYIQKQHDTARLWFSEALARIRDDFWRGVIVRDLAVSSAYSGDKRSFEKAEAEIRTLLNKGVFSRLMSVDMLEALARGHALLDPSGYQGILDEGWSELAKAEAEGERGSHQRLQLMRSQIVAVSSQGAQDTAALEEIGQAALVLARQERFFRYATEIEKLLQHLLN